MAKTQTPAVPPVVLTLTAWQSAAAQMAAACTKSSGIKHELESVGAGVGQAAKAFALAVAADAQDVDAAWPESLRVTGKTPKGKDIKTVRGTSKYYDAFLDHMGADYEEETARQRYRSMRTLVRAAKVSPALFGSADDRLNYDELGKYVAVPIVNNKLDTVILKKEDVVAAKAAAAAKAKAEKEDEAAKAATAANEPFNLVARAIEGWKAQGYADLTGALVVEVEKLKQAIIARADAQKRAADIAAQTPQPPVVAPVAPVAPPIVEQNTALADLLSKATANLLKGGVPQEIAANIAALTFGLK